jgi:hypothetical protein
MLAALVLLFSSVSRLPLHLASVVGGIGFGLFLDELGKFVTADNDYFWRPAVSFIYLCFVALYFGTRALGRRLAPSPESSQANALELAKEGVLRDLDPEERRRALELLARCDARDPIVPALEGFLRRQETVPAALPAPWARFQRSVERVLERWLHAPAFVRGFGAFAALAALAAVVEAIGNLRTVETGREFLALSQLIAAAICAGLVALGLLRWRRSRADAWRLVRLATLVSVLVVQALAFYREALVAMVGLAVSLLIGVIAGMLLRRERRPAARSGGKTGLLRNAGPRDSR